MGGDEGWSRNVKFCRPLEFGHCHESRDEGHRLWMTRNLRDLHLMGRMGEDEWN